jgi:hypothetical protein
LKSKRIDFRRRPETADKQLLIICFDGVLGSITQKTVLDDTFNLTLRHDTIQGLIELKPMYQIAIMTFLNEKLARFIVHHLDKEKVHIDGFYSVIKRFKTSDEFVNYNQIF